MTTLTSFSKTDLVDDHVAADVNKLIAAVLRAEYANTETISATRVLADIDCQFQFLTASGADRSVLLAPEATTNHVTIICNAGGSNNVLVKDDSGVTTFSTLAPGEWDIYYPLNAKGWKVKAGTTFATSAEVLTGTETAKAVNPDTLNDIVTRIPNSGQILNGKINVTVVASDLILKILTNAGADPSATDPVYINIAGTIRTITAATSCTLADGTNWFAAGSAELATKTIRYFAYAIWDSNSSVVAVGPARIPWGRLVSDFSATTTNEKYIGNYANYTTTDDVCVIGAFDATLSAGAGYTWTVPTFTSANLILKPEYDTGWLDWVPAHFAGGANYTNAPTNNRAKYRITKDHDMRIDVAFTYNATSGGSSYSRLTNPFTPAYDAIALSALNATAGTSCQSQTSGGYVYVYKYDGTTPIVNSQQIGVNGVVPI